MNSQAQQVTDPDSRKTAIGVVETAEGPVQHCRVRTPQGEIYAPVRLRLGVRADDGAPVPERTPNGNLVSALPGGGRLAAA